MIMMAGGRFLGDGLIGKFGRKPSLQTSGIMISAGLLQPYSSPVCHSRNHRIYCWFGSFHHSSCIQFTVWPENPKCIAQRSLNHTVSSVCLWFSWVRQSSGHRGAVVSPDFHSYLLCFWDSSPMVSLNQSNMNNYKFFRAQHFSLP
jgi:hypothetical protein